MTQRYIKEQWMAISFSISPSIVNFGTIKGTSNGLICGCVEYKLYKNYVFSKCGFIERIAI